MEKMKKLDGKLSGKRVVAMLMALVIDVCTYSYMTQRIKEHLHIFQIALTIQQRSFLQGNLSEIPEAAFLHYDHPMKIRYAFLNNFSFYLCLSLLVCLSAILLYTWSNRQNHWPAKIF